MNIYFTDYFKKQLKDLKKKYPHAKEDLIDTLDIFNPGKEIMIGGSIYKIRIISRDMKRGKAGGFRAYVFLFVKKNILVPLYIYSKTEIENISRNDLKYYFDRVIEDLMGL